MKIVYLDLMLQIEPPKPQWGNRCVDDSVDGGQIQGASWQVCGTYSYFAGIPLYPSCGVGHQYQAVGKQHHCLLKDADFDRQYLDGGDGDPQEQGDRGTLVEASH
eukprot:TRINITY_DN23926_c0_g1_i1.p3 TRINITY_DN23926_c0_g1~~TRINITY_DN23926_c0_g1_i1.p3  ORF type:complete len:105 (-),score=2.50 TRINITY_DN23926_c0_g1_i1:286-600(-)